MSKSEAASRKMSNSPTQHEMVLKNETSCASIGPFKKNIICDIYAPLTFRKDFQWLPLLTVCTVIHCCEHGKSFLYLDFPTFCYTLL